MTEAACVETTSVQSHDEVDLTDDQVQRLLLEAESRLQSAHQNDAGIRDGHVPSKQDPSRCVAPRPTDWQCRTAGLTTCIRIPKLSCGPSLGIYVHQGEEAATADVAQIIDPKQKQLSNSLRSIETKKLSKVSVKLYPQAP